MIREVKNGVIIGGMAGVLIWLFDFRYIILGGPPGTRIAHVINGLISTDSICNIKVEGAKIICSTMVPLFVLTVLGMVAGLLLMGVVRMVRK